MDSKVVPKGDVNNQYEKHTVTVTKHLTSQENVRRLDFFSFPYRRHNNQNNHNCRCGQFNSFSSRNKPRQYVKLSRFLTLSLAAEKEGEIGLETR